MSKYLLVVFLLTISFSSFGEKASGVFIQKQQWENYSKKYDYTENFKKLPAKKKKQHSSKSKIPDFSGSMKMKIPVTVAVILFLSFLLILLLMNIFKGSREKVSSQNLTVKNLNPDDLDRIEDADLVRLLDEALQQGLYKDAVRIKYLMLIRKMSRGKLIIWKKDKTNGTYMEEMMGKNGYHLFFKITISFERIWYGEREIGEQDYRNLEPVFDEIYKVIVPTNQ